MQPESGLSLTQAPPISVPFRYFLSAPLFGIFAACLLIGYGPSATASRWTPLVLGATHLLTLGYISMAMIGAISQMLAVVAGSPLPRPRPISAAIHSMLTLGALALAIGLLIKFGWLIRAAMLALSLGLLLFLAAAAVSLARAGAHNSTVYGMRLAVASLAVALAFGLSIALNHLGTLTLPQPSLFTNVHLAWGLIGWVGLLVISVAYEFVPMFQMTPHYPHWMQRWLAKLMFSCLVLWSIASLLAFFDPRLPAQLASLLSIFLALGLMLFAAMTLYLQSRRRRRLADITLLFWRISMLALLCCALLWIAAQFWPSLADWRQFAILLGVLFIAGFSVSVINGMLYKIVPFLVWLHLQGRNRGRASLPTVKEIIPEKWTRRQFYLHTAALLLLTGAVLGPAWFVYPAAALFALSFTLLWLNLFAALRVYRRLTMKLTMAD